MAQKILAAHSDKKCIVQGEIVNASVDLVLGNDITMPLAIEEFKKIETNKIFNRGKVVMVPDHFTPNKDIKSATQCKVMRDFAREQDIINYFEIGQMGIEHVLLPEKGLVLPGYLTIGADSHTCTYGALGAAATGVGSTDVAVAMATGKLWFMVPGTLKFVYKGKLGRWITGKDIVLYTIGMIGVDGALYKSMEFSGSVIEGLSMDSRFAMANMAIEAGGKFGLFEVDEKTISYVESKTDSDYKVFKSDDDAQFDGVYEIDCSGMGLQVAYPHLPSNTKDAADAKDVTIDQVVIGSCTNGRMEDLEMVAKILKGKKTDKRIRTIIIPATQKIYLDAVKRGLIEIFIKAGCVVSTPTCGPCLGGHMGILAEGERAVATTNRNFVGRMGHPKSEVYLAGPAVAAASAITGRISVPEEVI